VLQALGQLLGDSGVEVWVSNSGRIALVPADNPPATPALEEGVSAPVVAAVITGRVVDSASSRPLAGAQIQVVGTPLGAMTNEAGRFTIAGVPAGTHTVRATLLGFGPQSRTVTVADGQSVTIDFVLRRQAVELEQVVTVGYGTQTARNVTGSVANVNMSRVEGQAVEGVDKALAGQVAGVQVLQSNGVPGGGPQIQIRGVGAIGAGSQPLFVVDGFPLPSGGVETRNPLNEIAPGDIESITVLKDASSAAIYGSRAANGVVVITTKSGRNQATTARLDYAASMQTVPSRYLPDVMNAPEFAQFMKELNEDNVRYNLKREPTINDIPLEYRDPSQYVGTGTNWLDEVIRNAPSHNLNLSVSGGTQTISGYLSGGLLNELGTVEGTDYRRASMRASVTANPSAKWRVGLNLAPVYELRNLPVTGGAGRGENGSPAGASIVSPLLSPFNDDGSWRAMIASPQMLSNPNPLMYLRQYTNKFQNLRGIGNATIEFRPIDGLLLKSQANADFSEQQQSNYRPSTLGLFVQPPPRVPVANYNESNALNWLTEQTATYDRNFGRHHAQLLGAFSVQSHRDLGGNFQGTNFSNDDIQTLNAAALITGNTNAQRWGLVSYVTRLNYDFADGKYLASAAIRRDGSSRFAEANRWGVFPSVSVGWRLSEEPFFKRASWLSDLKLRAAYGQTGNNDLGNYSYVGQVGINDYVLNNSLASGRSLNTLGNPDLGWEKTSEVDVGLDLAMFNNRVTVTADAYNGITRDLLLNVEIPNSSGFGTVTKNTGRVRNRGLEIAMHTVNMQRNSFQWTSDFNIAMNRNLVLALGANNAPIRSGASGEQSPTHITMVGQPVGMFYGYVFQGLYKDDADVAASAKFAGAIPGNVKMKDINGDGNITAISDFDIIGNPYPDATFGINNNLSLGRFDLSLIMTGQLGGQRMQGFFEYLHNIDGVFNVSRDVANRWRSPSQPGDGEHPTTAGVSRGRVIYRDVSSLWVHDATNLNVRNVTVRYHIPDRLAVGRMKDASVYLGLQNALTISSYPMNPEVTNYNRQTGALTPGYDAVAYPIARTFTFGTQFGF
jgi:TonB-linked SusC/RagA family outer membrane protein